MNLEFALSKIPAHMVSGAKAYVLTGQHTGGFLRAVLENDLVGAGRKADDLNGRCLHGWACFLDNIPVAAWGSKERVDAWIEARGMIGHDNRAS